MGIHLYAGDLIPLVALAVLAVNLDKMFDRRARAPERFEADVLRDLAVLYENGQNVALLRDVPPSARRHGTAHRPGWPRGEVVAGKRQSSRTE